LLLLFICEKSWDDYINFHFFFFPHSHFILFRNVDLSIV
jgi:hypothetical protein